MKCPECGKNTGLQCPHCAKEEAVPAKKKPQKRKKIRQFDISVLPKWAQKYIERFHGLVVPLKYCRACGDLCQEGFVCDCGHDESSDHELKELCPPRVIDHNIWE